MRRAPLAPTVLILAGCGNAADFVGSPSFSVTDSADVEVVRNGGGPSVPESSNVTLRIGTLEGDPAYQFFRLAAMTRGSGGEVYALDAGHGEVRVFDPEGRYLRSYGRRGDGPGELQFPTGLWVLGDTLLVSDVQLGRVTLFGPEGGVLETWSTTTSETRPGRIGLLGPAPGGWIVVPSRPGQGRYEVGIPHRMTTRIAFASSIPGAVAALGSMEDPERPLETPAVEWREILAFPGPRSFGVNTPLAMTATRPLYEPSPRYTVDGRGRLHYSPSDSYVIDTYDSAGRHVRRLTRDHTPIAVTSELVDRYRDRARAHWDTASMAGEAVLMRTNDEVRPGLPRVADLPPVGRILASTGGALWVERIDRVPDPLDLEWQRPPPPPAQTEWDRFDPAGRFLGAVTLPPGFTPQVVGEDWALGVLRDELDVQYVARVEVVGG